MGVVIGIVIISGIPKEYTANTLIAPESTRRSSSSGMSALADMAGIDMDSSTEQVFLKLKYADRKTAPLSLLPDTCKNVKRSLGGALLHPHRPS